MNGHSVPPAEDPAHDPVQERARLEAEIAVAKQRTAAAKQAATAKDLEARAALRAELETTRAVLAEIERRHHEAVAELRAATESALARILAQASGADAVVSTDDE